jgi:phosphoribosylformylglycinamidine synthase
VQVGDPFEEKKLIEACLELYDLKLVAGVQDLGAAGLSCAVSEPAARAGVGMEVDLDKVHVREPDMTAAELLMSESQERMMVFVPPDQVDEVLAVAEKWEIDASVIGTVTEGDTLRVFYRGELVVEVPASALTDEAPRYDRPMRPPAPLPPPPGAAATLGEVQLVGPPEGALDGATDNADLTRSVYRQFDHMLNLSTVIGPGEGAALLRIPGTDKGLAVSVDGNPRACASDPRAGAAELVKKAAMKVAAVGARPIAVVDNLNFGNPENPEVMWQVRETIEGISEACEELGIPVVGGNVSFYNETDGVDIPPTPVIGMLALAESVSYQDDQRI